MGFTQIIVTKVIMRFSFNGWQRPAPTETTPQVSAG